MRPSEAPVTSADDWSRLDRVAGLAEERPSAVQRALDDRSAGRPLDTHLRDELASGLPEVKVHADDSASALAAGIGADAFTRGADIYFGAGMYQPYSPGGRELLRHELAHVMQQASGEVAEFAGRVIPAEHPSESHARSGSALDRRALAPETRDSGMQREVIQRQPSSPGRTAAIAPPQGPLSKDGVKEIFDALVNEWGRISAAMTQTRGGDKMKGECAAFIVMIAEKPHYEASRVEINIMGRVGVDRSDRARLAEFQTEYPVAISRFATDIGRKVLSDLRASSSDPTQTWQWVQQEFAEYLADGGRGLAFNDMATDAILGDVVKTVAKETHRKPAELGEMVNNEVVQHIDKFCNNLLHAVEQAGASFYLPMPVSGHVNASAIGAASTRFAYEMGEILFHEAGHLVKLGIHTIPFATFALELVSLWQEEKEQEERIRKENQRGSLQRTAQRSFFKEWDKIVTAIQNREATLAILVVAEAVKQNINPKALGTNRLDDIIIKSLGFDPDVRFIDKIAEKLSEKLDEAIPELQKKVTE